MIGDVLLDCGWAGETLAGFENHAAGRSSTRAPSRSAGSCAASATTARAGYEGCRVGRVYGTYLHGPLLPRNPWFADRAARGRARPRTGETVELEPLPTSSSAHEVAQRGRSAVAATGRVDELR